MMRVALLTLAVLFALCDAQGLEDLLGGLGLGAGDDDRGCVFQCPRGSVARPRAHHRPSSNGCGSGGFRLDVSRFEGVEQCCHQHDIDYDTCGKKRDAADAAFQVAFDFVCFVISVLTGEALVDAGLFEESVREERQVEAGVSANRGDDDFGRGVVGLQSVLGFAAQRVRVRAERREEAGVVMVTIE